MRNMRSLIALTCLAGLVALAGLALAPALCLGAPAEAAGEAASLVMERCTVCHDTQRICRNLGKKGQKGWAAEIKEMVEKGAKLSGAEQAQAAAFLAGLKAGAAPICR